MSTGRIQGRRREETPRGFWAWAEHVYEDPAKRALLLRWFWLISLGFLTFGVVIMVLVYLGRMR